MTPVRSFIDEMVSSYSLNAAGFESNRKAV